MSIGEWQEGDDPFETKKDTAAKKKENANSALIFAQKYKVFESGVAKDLLEFWTQKARRTKTPPSASATEFAYQAGWREFVESIHAQIEFANNGGLSPYKEI